MPQFFVIFPSSESACSPIGVSIITDHFSDNLRGTATGIFHWGVYFGYGLSYAIGVYVTSANLFGLGWRMCYLLAGIPGKGGLHKLCNTNLDKI